LADFSKGEELRSDRGQILSTTNFEFFNRLPERVLKGVLTALVAQADPESGLSRRRAAVHRRRDV
jgi:hypothetical protein